jgi:hypothetical protein
MRVQQPWVRPRSTSFGGPLILTCGAATLRRHGLKSGEHIGLTALLFMLLRRHGLKSGEHIGLTALLFMLLISKVHRQGPADAINPHQTKSTCTGAT